MDFLKLKRMKSMTRKYVTNFLSRPSGSNRSKILSQIDMLEGKILDEKDELKESQLDEEDINNLIKQKSKLESVLLSFPDVEIDKSQRKKFQEALDGFYYECKVAEMKLRGESVDPSEFREERKEKKAEEGEEEEVSEEDIPLNIDKAMG